MDISNAIYTNKRVNDLSTQTTTAISTALNAAKGYADTEIEEAFDAVTAADIPTSDDSDVQTKLTSYATTLSGHTTTLGDHTSQLADMTQQYQATIDAIQAGDTENANAAQLILAAGTDANLPTRLTRHENEFADIINKYQASKNLINPDKMVSGYIDTSGGQIVDSASYFTTDYIPITAGQSITMSPKIRKFLAYNGSKIPIVSSFISTEQTPSYTYTAVDNSYIRATFYASAIGVTAQAEYGESVTEYEAFGYILAGDVYLNDKQKQIIIDMSTSTASSIKSKIVTDDINLIDPTATTSGIIDTSSGVIVANASYKTTDFIPISSGQSITISPKSRKFLAYNSSKAVITSSYVSAAQETPYTYTATQDGYIRASVYASYIGVSAQAEYGSISTPYIEYGKRRLATQVEQNLETEARIANLEYVAGHIGNILYNKKWCACGDSFTQGDFTGLQESEYKLSSGRYAGNNAVYPFLIGNRNDMNVVNIAVGGMTMCCIDGTRQNSFTYNNYYQTNIPLDSDYITLKFGINDNNYSSPLGTIDDMVNTTFYGSWNVVLDYLTQTFPTDKIGIIITNGITDTPGKQYLDATIAISKKWGIAYLDEVNDDGIPLLHRVKRENLSSTAYDRKMAAFRVSESNLHPNVAAHDYESTIVEHWLRSL